MFLVKTGKFGAIKQDYSKATGYFRSSKINEVFQGVQATSDKALKTGDMGLSKHRQATQH